jgi:hypothetical protein
MKSGKWCYLPIKVQKTEHFLPASLLDENEFSTGTADYSQLGACTEPQSLIISGSRKEAYGKKRSEKHPSLHGNEKQDTLGEK